MYDIHAILKRYWHYDSFRPLQQEIIESLLSGRDTLGLMPTGGGKSITFQVPALARDGFAIVVTPLISLMKDQVDNLKRRRIKAVYLHSGMSMRERMLAEERIMNGNIKLLYVSPERLRNERFIQMLRMAEVSFIVVDEAHCISQWGYDFRPAYLNISTLRSLFPHLPLLALTATATPLVAEDICRQLKMKEPAVFRMSFARRNINYIVRKSQTKIYEAFHILSRTSGSSIVYVRSRKKTKEIAEYLINAGIPATFYHAGLDSEIKEQRQNQWQQGGVRVIVATNAFGMGIDKPDVRVVIHCDMPPSLEEYYQEAGRAGRDGKASWAVLLVSDKDKSIAKRRITEAYPPRDDIKMLYETVCNFLHISVGEGYDTMAEFDMEKFCEIFNVQQKRCLASLRLLGQARYMEYIEETERQSRLMILLTREELYHLDKPSRNAETVLSAMLRMYPGLFSDYVFISEGALSRETKLGETEIYDALLELARRKVIHYVPRSRTPYIYFPTSREERRYLLIGKDIYEERRKILEERTDAMLNYAYSGNNCREKIMLEYFGQENGVDCGRCDVCRDKKKIGSTKKREELQKLCKYVEMHKNGVTLPVMQHELSIPSERYRDYLSHLASEGFIRIDNGRIFPIS